jgi:hypothetical protein
MNIRDDAESEVCVEPIDSPENSAKYDAATSESRPSRKSSPFDAGFHQNQRLESFTKGSFKPGEFSAGSQIAP